MTRYRRFHVNTYNKINMNMNNTLLIHAKSTFDVQAARAFVRAAVVIAENWPGCPWRLKSYEPESWADVEDVAGAAYFSGPGDITESFMLTVNTFDGWRLRFLTGLADFGPVAFSADIDANAITIHAPGGVTFRRINLNDNHFNTADPYNIALLRLLACAFIEDWVLVDAEGRFAV